MLHCQEVGRYLVGMGVSLYTSDNNSNRGERLLTRCGL